MREHKNNYSKRIVLFFYNEGLSDFFIRAQEIEAYRSDGAHIIYVGPEDFENGRLKENVAQEKYQAFLTVDNFTKITIAGHGSPNESKDAIWDDGGNRFSAEEVASIFELIPAKSSARVSRDQLKNVGDLPTQHLRISMHTCYGENFSKHLAKALCNSPALDKLIFSITAGEKNKSIMRRGRIDEKLKHLKYVSDFDASLGIRALQLSFLAAVALGIAAGVEKNLDLGMGSVAALGLFVFLMIVIFWPRNNVSNSQHKVALFPNFAENSDSQPYRIVSKDDFKQYGAQAPDLYPEPSVDSDEPEGNDYAQFSGARFSYGVGY